MHIKMSPTLAHNMVETIHAKNKCLTVSIFLQRLPSRGFPQVIIGNNFVLREDP
jgi:hypothetical protein